LEDDHASDCKSEYDPKPKKDNEPGIIPWTGRKVTEIPTDEIERIVLDVPMDEIDIRGNTVQKTKFSSIAEIPPSKRRKSMYSRSDLKYNEGEEKKKEFFSGGAFRRRGKSKRKIDSKFTPKKIYRQTFGHRQQFQYIYVIGYWRVSKRGLAEPELLQQAQSHFRT
jgi:hypothetical protein